MNDQMGIILITPARFFFFLQPRMTSFSDVIFFKYEKSQHFKNIKYFENLKIFKNLKISKFQCKLFVGEAERLDSVGGSWGVICVVC